jgi:hypothetical protein
MHPEILLPQIRDHHDSLRREASAARLGLEARRARNPHVDEPRVRAARPSLFEWIAARLASA